MNILSDDAYMKTIHYIPIPEHDIRKVAQAQHKDTLRQVRELLDEIENPYKITENYCYVLPNKDYALCSDVVSGKYFAYGFDVAIQTIKALLEE